MIRNVNVSFPFIISVADYHSFTHAAYIFSQMIKAPVRWKEFEVTGNPADWIADLTWDHQARAVYFAVMYTDDQAEGYLNNFIRAFLLS